MCVLFPFPLPNFQGQGIPWGTYVSQFLISYEPVLGRLFPFWGTILQTTNLFFPWEKFLVVSALHTFLCLSSLCGWKSEERSRSKAVSGRPKRWSKALLKAFFFFFLRQRWTSVLCLFPNPPLAPRSFQGIKEPGCFSLRQWYLLPFVLTVCSGWALIRWAHTAQEYDHGGKRPGIFFLTPPKLYQQLPLILTIPHTISVGNW